MKRKLSALILGAAALAVGFGSLAVAGVVAHKDAILQTKAAEQNVTLSNIGKSLGTTANTTAATTTVSGYVLNYYQCKQQNNKGEYSMFLTKGQDPYISNHTKVPGSIVSVTIKTGNGSSAKTSYRCTFGTNEFTEAPTTTTGETAIPGTGKTHTFTNSGSNAVPGAAYFALSLGNTNNGQIANITIVYDDGSGATYDVAVASNSSTTGVGTGGTLALTASTDGDSGDTYTWSSSDTSIATVDSNGVVTGVAAGAVTITATSKTHSGKSGSIDITVFAAESYELVTSDLDGYAGTYVIGYGSEVFNGTSGGGNHVTGSLVDDVITVNAECALTVASYGSGYSIQTAAGTYLAAKTSDSNGLTLESSPTAFSFSVADGDVTITALDSGYNQVLRYNPTDSMFNFYKSSTYTGQKAIQLYQIPDLTTKSITVSSSSVELDKGADSETITITSKNFTADSYEVVSSDETVAEAIVDGNSIVVSGVAYGTATITVNAYLGSEIVAFAEIAVKVNDPDRVLTIAEARQASKDEVVTYSGTIIAKETSGSTTNYYIQQGSKGIEAFKVADNSFNIGDGVKVTGTLSTYNGLYQTSNNTMVSYEEAKEDISPAELSVTYNDDDCTLVSATGLTFDSGDWKSGESANINFKISSNKSIQIHISKAISASLYAKLDWGKRTGEEIYSLTGVKGIYNGTVQCFIVEGCVLSTDADEAAVDNFVATYITTPGAEDYTTIAEADRQASCVNKYTAAKAALEALTENQQSLFNYSAKYADAREIYNIWKAAYDAQNGGSGAGMLTFDSKETQNTVLISTLGAAAVVAAAGFIFLKKKKA